MGPVVGSPHGGGGDLSPQFLPPNPGTGGGRGHPPQAHPPSTWCERGSPMVITTRIRTSVMMR